MSVSSLSPDGQWETLPPSEKREKEVFLASEKRASRGFISQANKQMQLLDTLSEMTSITCCLCQPPLARRTAGAVSKQSLIIIHVVFSVSICWTLIDVRVYTYTVWSKGFRTKR